MTSVSLAAKAGFGVTCWAVLLLLTALVCLSCASDRPTLRLKADGTFKILQFTDLHFGIDKETSSTAHVT